MRVEFWGVRGASPASDPDKMRYGGNTNCIVITSNDAPDHFFILDAGTGLTRFGATLSPIASVESTILLSHLHLQHIIGFQFTPLAFGKNYKTLVLGPSPRDMRMSHVFDTIMEPHYSPVSGIGNLLAKVKFVEVDSQLRQIGDVLLIAMPFEHSQDTHSWGYRLEDKTSSVVYLTDTTMREQDGSLSQGAIRLSHKVSMLIVGADDPLHQRPDSTSYDDAIELAIVSGAKHLILHHHHPDATDDELDQSQAQLQGRYPSLKITIAAERMIFNL